MEDAFVSLLYSSVWGSLLILLVMALRLLFRKTPRRILCVLWLLCAVSLLVPLRVQTLISLQPSPQTIDTAVQEIIYESYTSSNNPAGDAVPRFRVLSRIWAMGAGLLLFYTCLSYWIVKGKVRFAHKDAEGIYISSRIPGAFVLGYFKPRIYLPGQLKENERKYVVAHEITHIARKDHWWKLLGFLCVCIHWFNPLVWLGYVLFCRDIEMACDEQVIHRMTLQERKEYSLALVGSGRHIAGISACPVAFGEVGLKRRIKNVLTYRKPGFRTCVVTILLVAAVAISFLTLPQQGDRQESEPLATTEMTTEATTEATTEVTTEATIEATEPAMQIPAKPTTPPLPAYTSPGDGQWDMNEVDASVTAYAAGLGFRTMEYHQNSNVKQFSYGSYFWIKDVQQELCEKGLELVDQAAAYCHKVGSPIGSSVIWVRVVRNERENYYGIQVFCATVS